MHCFLFKFFFSEILLKNFFQENLQGAVNLNEKMNSIQGGVHAFVACEGDL